MCFQIYSVFHQDWNFVPPGDQKTTEAIFLKSHFFVVVAVTLHLNPLFLFSNHINQGNNHGIKSVFNFIQFLVKTGTSFHLGIQQTMEAIFLESSFFHGDSGEFAPQSLILNSNQGRATE